MAATEAEGACGRLAAVEHEDQNRVAFYLLRDAGVSHCPPHFMNRDHVTFLIPGPIEVSENTFSAMSKPMTTRRTGNYLYSKVADRTMASEGNETE